MNFVSDNEAGVAAEILSAVAAEAGGFTPSYGTDRLTSAVEARLRALFEAPEARVYLVSTGTAANALALGALCPPWGTVFCHDLAHIEVDECNAPEFFTGGAKLSLVGGDQAKMTPALLAEAIDRRIAGDAHNPQPAALSITQATERGAAYSVDELVALCQVAKAAGIAVHMDGTRVANAIRRQNASPADMTWRAGVDVLCLGATKNGAMAAEAVVLFDPSRAWELELRRKRAGHLFSKMRFLSAQILAYLTDDLWLRLAGHANAMADRLAAGLDAMPGINRVNDLGANIVFAEIPYARHLALAAAGARYKTYPEGREPDGADGAPVLVRLVCSFSTTEAEVDRFLEVLAR